ncbi:MAG: NADH-quinone oxidoreductase subunit NuoE [Bacteroidia bacterium]|nr:NADH-quinone oxidoreductase subunit NuoE [Bacteroidia bacterium]MCZ2278227.1 NADH-quinone oxidoreductase subunit NuoE [Bacteroidia bacterium]
MAKEKVVSDEAKKEIEKLFHHLPHKQAACIDALKIVQKYNRWVSDQALEELAPILEMSPNEIDSVATFYNIIFRKPVGRHVIFLCNSVSCWIMGYEDIRKAIKEKLQIDFGMTTKDNRFTFLPIPCLGTCDHAPALIIDEDLYRDLKPAQLDEILAKYE